MNYFSYDEKFQIDPGEKIVVLGKTGSGKSTFVRNLIKYRDITFRKPVTKIVYVYKFVQDWFEELRDIVDFVQDIPTSLTPGEHTLLIVDDACEKSFEEISQWFLRSARHNKTTIVFIYQSVFNTSSDSFKRIINNTDIFVFSFQPKGIFQLSILFRQFFGNKEQVKDALNLYRECMQTKYSYLIFDVRQGVNFPFRRNIFCEYGQVEEAFKI
jgi:ABC-type dipeptide/oligopeptide/nickel transport system ATPase component